MRPPIRQMALPIVLVAALLLVSHGSAQAFVCGMSDTANQADCPGLDLLHFSSLDTCKALAAFVRIREDTASGWDACGWPEDLGTTLPPWAADFLDSSLASAATGGSRAGTLSDYFFEQSGGRYVLWGEVVDTVLQTYGTCSQYSGWGDINREIIERLDATYDFAQFDNSPQDGWVDMIFLIYRYYPCPAPSGIANLQFDGYYSTDDTTAQGETVKICGGSGGSGLTMGEALAGERWTQYIAAHEHLHNLFRGHFDLPSGWGRDSHLSTAFGAYGILDPCDHGNVASGIERYLLSWVDTDTIWPGRGAGWDSLLTGYRLWDSAHPESANALKIMVSSPEAPFGSLEYFLVYNRRGQSYYEQAAPGIPSECNVDVPSRGVFIEHIAHWSDRTSWGWGHKKVDIECADGLWWPKPLDTAACPNPCYWRSYDDLDTLITVDSSDSLDAFNEANNNAFAPYTDPSCHAYVMVVAEATRSTIRPATPESIW